MSTVKTVVFLKLKNLVLDKKSNIFAEIHCVGFLKIGKVKFEYDIKYQPCNILKTKKCNKWVLLTLKRNGAIINLTFEELWTWINIILPIHRSFFDVEQDLGKNFFFTNIFKNGVVRSELTEYNEQIIKMLNNPKFDCQIPP